jgi:hypothetical protein
MTMNVKPIGPPGFPAVSGATAPTQQELQRTVKAGVEALGGANNYAAQNAVQKRQDGEARKQSSHLIDRRIVTATIAALAPVGGAHDEDEADAEREQGMFGSELPYQRSRRVPGVNKKPRR